MDHLNPRIVKRVHAHGSSFAEPAARFLVLLLFPFSGLPMASRLHSSLASVVKEGDLDQLRK